MNPKIKVLISTGEGWYSEAFVSMFRSNGCETKLLEHPSSSVLKLERKNPLMRIHPRMQLNKINRMILDAVKTFKPDLMFVVNGEELFPETVKRIAAKTKIAHWAVDGVGGLKMHLESLGNYHRNYVFEPTDVPLVPGSRYLSLGADTRRYFPRRAEKIHDVTFVGSPHADRLPLLEKLAKESAGKFGFAVFGPFQKVDPAAFPHLCSSVRKNGTLSHDEIAEIYSQSRISLNPHHSHSKVGVNPRVFEIAACGAFQLCSEQRALADFFPDGEVPTYRNADDLLEKIAHFLENADERERLAAAARKRTEHENTFAARGRTVLEDMLGELPKHEPKFSVITVCRNAEKTIERTIRSVIAQTYPNKEFVVVDGASKDGTLGIIEKYREQIDVFVSEPDKGIYDAMNKAVSLATGDYVIFINADDYLYDENVLRRASEVPEADFLFGGQYDLCPDGKLLPAKNLDGLDAYHLFRGFFAHQTIFAKRNLWKRFGGFDQNYKICADRDWLLRCFTKGEMTTAKIGSVVAVYTLGGFSDTQRDLHNLETASLLESNLGKIRIERALQRFEKIFRNALLKTKLHGVFIALMKKRFQKKYPTRTL